MQLLLVPIMSSFCYSTDVIPKIDEIRDNYRKPGQTINI